MNNNRVDKLTICLDLTRLFSILGNLLFVHSTVPSNPVVQVNERVRGKTLDLTGGLQGYRPLSSQVL